MVLTAFITDSTPLCPPEFLPKEILIFPNGKSMSSWTTIKLSAFFGRSDDVFQSVAGFVHKSFRQNYLDFLLARRSFSEGGASDSPLPTKAFIFLSKTSSPIPSFFSCQFQNNHPPGVMPSQFVFLPWISQTDDIMHKIILASFS